MPAFNFFLVICVLVAGYRFTIVFIDIGIKEDRKKASMVVKNDDAEAAISKDERSRFKKGFDNLSENLASLWRRITRQKTSV